jgi:hypothetical protein
MNERTRKREQVTARLDDSTFAAVEAVATAERRPLSEVVRHVLSDWAAARAAPSAQQGHAS